MLIESFNLLLTKSMLVEHGDIDYEQILYSLREFRSTVASKGEQFQISVFKNGFIPRLFAFVDKMFLVQPPLPNSMLAFSVGVQCIVNLMSDNDVIRTYVADHYIKMIIGWLKIEGSTQQNYVCAALLNVDKVGKLAKELENAGFVHDLIRTAELGTEFGVLLLQNLLSSGHFCKIYEAAEEAQRFFLLQLLETMMADINNCEFVEEVTFVCSKFKKSCNNVMSSIPSVGSFAALELALMLEFLSSTSYKSGYIATVQGDASLVINSAYLLRGIQNVVSQKKTWKESIKEAVESIRQKNSLQAQGPFFGVKGNLIRLLGNLAYKHKANQDQIREAGCIPIILDSCKLDGENPFIKEWSILTTRNLCDENFENQTLIKNMNYQGYDLGVMQEMSLTLNDDEGNAINIAPVSRR